MSQTIERRRSGPAVGFIVFAGVAMVMIGAFHALQGLVALFNDDFYVVGQKWIFEFDLTTWGWVHLIVGIGVALAGFFVFNGAVWARAVGHRRRRRQRTVELHLAALLPDLEPDHHRARCDGRLGAVRPRPRLRPLTAAARPDSARRCHVRRVR